MVTFHRDHRSSDATPIIAGRPSKKEKELRGVTPPYDYLAIFCCVRSWPPALGLVEKAGLP
ncbi:MAG: hypothetical protein CO189_03450 [candidate division Zixibacteria bacterium CG_4_9_14_3_um_filter_46_8]|nr:MAG: hypothetical protein CO189_03450 [candidate division Zixibacteria bacterium CG_4_9_14_3_um_filter_46_8]